MKYLLLLLPLSLQATPYYADFAPAETQRTLYANFGECTPKTCVVEYILKHKGSVTPMTPIRFGQSKLVRADSMCNGVSTNRYSFDIKVPRGLYALQIRSCNKIGCSDAVAVNLSDNTCDKQGIYFVGE